MSTISSAIIFLLFGGYLGFQLVKNFQLRSIMNALNTKQYETVQQISDMPMTRKLLGEYTCDLYKLRAYYLSKNENGFDNLLKQMILKDYNKNDKKNFLEFYFHTFLLKENKYYSTLLLDAIKSLNDEKFTLISEQSYEVMINNRCDLIHIMEEEINSKKYYGFSLGVIVYMIAKQYEAQGLLDKAALYYVNAKVCFDSKALYMPKVLESLEKLNDYVEKLNSVNV